MENVILIKVESLTDLEPAQNTFVINFTTGEMFRGNDADQPIQILDAKKPVLYSRIYLYE